MSQVMGVSISTVSKHIKKIGKVKKLNKWVLNETSESQTVLTYVSAELE